MTRQRKSSQPGGEAQLGVWVYVEANPNSQRYSRMTDSKPIPFEHLLYEIEQATEIRREEMTSLIIEDCNISEFFICQSMNKVCLPKLKQLKITGRDASVDSLCIVGYEDMVIEISDGYLSNVSINHCTGTSLYLKDCRVATLRGFSSTFTTFNIDERTITDNQNFSGCCLPNNPISWMKSNFIETKRGFIVYKHFNSYYLPPDTWKQTRNSYITEELDYNRHRECSFGVNFATPEWIHHNLIRAERISHPMPPHKPHSGYIWKCLIPKENYISIVVPYSTDGKARCGTLQLLKKYTVQEFCKMFNYVLPVRYIEEEEQK